MNKDEIKSQIEDILNSYNLDKGFIDRFVSDEFINGMYTLIQQEPQNNDFLIFIRSLSNEQNLVTIENIPEQTLVIQSMPMVEMIPLMPEMVMIRFTVELDSIP